MRKLMLAIGEKDECVQLGGPLCPKRWNVGNIAIHALSGFDNADQMHINLFGPRIVISATGDFYQNADFSKPFDIVQFEDCLKQAKEAVALMEDWIAGETLNQHRNMTAALEAPKVLDMESQDCPECNGRGHLIKHIPGEKLRFEVMCLTCGGFGKQRVPKC